MSALVLCAAGARAEPLPDAVRATVASTNAPAVTTNAPAGTLVLSLSRCLELALGGNLSIALGRLEPARSGENYYIAGEVFTPTLFASGTHGDQDARTSSTQAGATVLNTKEEDVQAGIRKTWALGTRTDLAWATARREDNSEYRTLNPSYDSALRLQVTQPLLKGFGLAVNRADLDRALLDKQIADREFEMLLDSELLATYRAYWALVRAAARHELEQTALALAAEQVRIIRNRMEVGAAAPLDLTSAEAAYARQQEAVITARNDYRKASDDLLFRIRPAGDLDGYNLALIPSTEAMPGPELKDIPDLRASVDLALASRPELQRGDRQIERAQIELVETRHARLPELNASGSYGHSGVESAFSDSAQDVQDGDFPAWTVGLSLEFLFDNESRRARWRQAVLSKTAAELGRQQAQAEVVLEVRAATFDLEASIQQVAATQRTLDLAREQYEGELDRLRVGSSTVFQVDSFRRDQLAADRNDLDARISLFVAHAVLDVARGRFAKALLATAQPTP
ncbi:MAG: TolC family protein [Lentisphaerae bacterium]|nr:TolC family protein [Lentisphaerota bacterium]